MPKNPKTFVVGESEGPVEFYWITFRVDPFEGIDCRDWIYKNLTEIETEHELKLQTTRFF